MERDIKTHLFDIIESCRLIKEFVEGMDLHSYEKNDLVSSAVERQFIVIGESLIRLKLLDLAVFSEIENSQRIIGFRNILVHGYDSVSDRLVWGIIQEKVPDLTSTCQHLLNRI